MIDGWFLSCLFIVPGPLPIKFMTRGFVQAEIDKLKGREQFTTKFTSEFERNRKAPPPAKSTRSAQQSAPPALDESFWGDHGVLLSLSMMWQVTITSLTAETYEEHRVRHKRRLPYVDLLVVWSGESHYLGTCKFSFITYIFV